MNEMIRTLYKGNEEQGQKVYDTLKHSYDYHADRINKPPIQHIDEALEYIQGLDNYITTHIKTYYKGGSKLK